MVYEYLLVQALIDKVGVKLALKNSTFYLLQTLTFVKP